MRSLDKSLEPVPNLAHWGRFVRVRVKPLMAGQRCVGTLGGTVGEESGRDVCKS